MSGVRPYSVRFMSGRGNTRRETFEVPEGRRAVVTNMSFAWWGAEGYCVLEVHGVDVYYMTRPAAYSSLFEAVRWTAYERETIRVTISTTDMSYAVDGYLLMDSNGRPDDADNLVETEWLGSRPAPLPSSETA